MKFLKYYTGIIIILFFIVGCSSDFSKKSDDTIAGDTVPPVYSSSYVDNLNTDTVVVLFSESVAVLSHEDFTVKVNSVERTITGFTSSSNKVSLQIDTDMLSNDAITVECSGSINVYDLSNNYLIVFTSQEVTNLIVAVYIDPSAGVSGDGSFGAPYKNWNDVTFQAGYLYLQKRGTLAREQITVNVSGTSDNPIIIGSYGSGDLPMIQGSEIETGWVVDSASIYSKNVNAGTGGLGMIAEDGTVLKYFEWDTNVTITFTGAAAGSFSYDYVTSNVYVWCSDSADPDTHSMEVSRRLFGIHANNISYVQMKNIHIRYVSLHGIAFEDGAYISVTGATIEKLGGAVIIPTGPIHAGNAIEFGNSSSYCSVDNVIISDIFDSGISPQTYSNDKAASNFTFTNSVVSYCGFAGVEIVALYNTGNINSSISNVLVKNINISNCGKGWSGVRYDGEGRGIKVCADISGANTAGSITGVIIEQCTISNNRREGVFLGGNAGTVIIKECMILNNGWEGVYAQELGSSTIRLNLSSSIIRENGFNEGGDLHHGVAYYVQDGNGFNLYHNTIYDNAYVGFVIAAHSGDAVLINNLFHSSSFKTHFYTAIDISGGADIQNNCFTEFGANLIFNYTSTTYSTVLDFDAAYAFAQNDIGSTDPKLNADLTLQDASSPCYQQGDTSTGISVDYSGNNYRNPPSIGAYEFY
jgi:parallel beta helix pectate lyase-like protein